MMNHSPLTGQLYQPSLPIGHLPPYSRPAIGQTLNLVDLRNAVGGFWRISVVVDEFGGRASGRGGVGSVERAAPTSSGQFRPLGDNFGGCW